MAVHVRGDLEILGDPEEALAVISHTTVRFEQRRAQPWNLGPSLEYTQQLLADLVAFRLEVTNIEGAFKLSQEQDQATRERLIAGLEAEPELARGDLQPTCGSLAVRARAAEACYMSPGNLVR